uniref:Uncharacterized protein n=2 Tax=Picea TaxID=3328 RepID=A0A124GN11_PICGL|nr:hypothetical protein ABT39_MTgene5531 [Picea glauca]QHR91599.1 hypothetical protein Q903MT_gene5634 [Picea sitchensis]
MLPRPEHLCPELTAFLLQLWWKCCCSVFELTKYDLLYLGRYMEWSRSSNWMENSVIYLYT